MEKPGPALLEALRRETPAGGSLPFDRFMETVLYHPDHGYYARSAHRAGREGDFLTSPETSSIFGACVLEWVEHTWRRLGGGTFHIVEVGAGRGSLALSLLEAAAPPLAEHLHLHVVERAAEPRRELESRLRSKAPPGTLHVYTDVDELPASLPAGAFVANELFDNLPVRRLMKGQGWQEIQIRVVGQSLREVLVPAAPELVAAAEQAGLQLSEGQVAEISPQAVPLLERVLRRFERGGLLVFDYGGEADEVSGEAAPQGTLEAYRAHAARGDLYAALGEQDITAHVNFTPLRAAAEALGFFPARLTNQSRFLIEHGLPQRLALMLERAKDDFERLRLTQVAKQLYHPEGMGDAFRVLVAIKER